MTRKNHLSQAAQRITPPPISWLMQCVLSHPKMVSLAAGFIDEDSLPAQETAEALQSLLNDYARTRTALQYGSTDGSPALREWITQRLALDDGLSATGYAGMEKRTLITHGSQQFLYLVTEALCDPGDIVLVEDPTYFVFLSILQSKGVQCRGISMTKDGMDGNDLDRVLADLKQQGLLSRVKFLYSVTYFQNPTGITTSEEHKKQAQQLLRRYEKAAGHPIYFLEDAGYRELQFSDNNPASALASRDSDRVIYSGTFSKPFATGIRVGYGCLPEPLFPVIHNLKGNHDFGTASFLQELLLHAIQMGLYDSHLKIVRQRYQEKCQRMLDGIKKHFPDSVRLIPPQGGLYCWIELPAACKCGFRSALFKQAVENNILYVPGEICYAPDPTRKSPKNHLRLSFGHATMDQIDLGIKRLGKVLNK